MVEGGPLVSKVVTFDKVTADETLAQQGNIALGDEVYRVVRLRYLNDILYDLEESYFPRTVVPFLSSERAAFNLRLLARGIWYYGSTTENYVHQVRVDAQRAELIGCPDGDKTLCLEAINYLANGTVFNFSRTFFVYPDLELYYHTENIDLQN
ncbi:UTRA domain-containing protein [Lactiplantibacillus plantarum]|nr:UTRA domain-containing protein [Lactiplantibacillus plantarum]